MLLTRRFAISGAILPNAAMTRAATPTAENPALYQATAIVTGTDMRQRPPGFSRRLTEVVAKPTGAPQLATKPAIAALAQHAEDLVASFT